MLINFVDATNDDNHNTKPPPVYILNTIRQREHRWLGQVLRSELLLWDILEV